MPIATGTALLLGGLASAGASAAAGKMQSGATKDAAQAAKDTSAESLAFQKQVWEKQQQDQAPWLQAGKDALGQLSTGLADGGQFTEKYGKTYDPGTFTGKYDPGKFVAPTGADYQNDPGYQFRLAEGQKALERSAAARGTATGGAALKAAARYGQDYASNEYGNVYERALKGYATNAAAGLDKYNTELGAFNTNANTGLNAFNTNYGVWRGNQTDAFNRLASLAGLGQTAAGQLSNAGSAAAGNVAGINSNLANLVGNFGTQGANAAAAGIVGGANAINGAIGNYQYNQLLQQILNSRGSGYSTASAPVYYGEPGIDY